MILLMFGIAAVAAVVAIDCIAVVVCIVCSRMSIMRMNADGLVVIIFDTIILTLVLGFVTVFFLLICFRWRHFARRRAFILVDNRLEHRGLDTRPHSWRPQ